MEQRTNSGVQLSIKYIYSKNLGRVEHQIGLSYIPLLNTVTMALLSEYTGPPYREVPFLWDAFQSTVDNMPDHLALGCVHQPADLFGVSSLALDDDSYRQNPYLRWTFRDIHTAVHCLITAWRRLGVEEGNLIVTFAQNSVEWVLAA